MRFFRNLSTNSRVLTSSSTFYRHRLFSTSAHKYTEENAHNFFNIIRKQVYPFSTNDVISFLGNHKKISASLHQMNCATANNYLYSQFVFWLSSYATHCPQAIDSYLRNERNLNLLANDFARFCFSQRIKLDKTRTLDSFSHHNQLSNNAVEKELLDAPSKSVCNILGYGLGEGDYERSIADFMISHNKAQQVNIYGFDPYTKRGVGICYLSETQMQTIPLQFDLIIARWALHHVALAYRWSNLIHCINRCSTSAQVLIVEHGFLKSSPPSLIEEKIYYIFNALFDVVANIGIRQEYFTDTAPDIGANFFIHYLTPKDFRDIKEGVSLQITQSVYDVGPQFPNQIICRMRSL